MSGITRAERLRREAAARKIVEAQEAAAKSKGPTRTVPGVVARELPRQEDHYTPQPLEIVKTKYQVGRDAYERENPGKDFDQLTYNEQAPWIAKGEAAWNEPQPGVPAPAPAPAPVPAPAPPPAEPVPEPAPESEQE